MWREPLVTEEESLDLQWCIDHFGEVPDERKIMVLSSMMLAHEAKRARQRMEDSQESDDL